MERLKDINEILNYNNEYLKDSIKAYKLIIRLIKEHEPESIERIKLFKNQIETIEHLIELNKNYIK